MSVTLTTTYTGDGAHDTYAIPFDYDTEDQVAVSWSTTGSPSFTFPSAGFIKLSANLANGVTLTISRNTKIDTPAETFQAGSGLPKAKLNRAVRQLLFAIQELSAYVTSVALGTGNVPNPAGNVGKWLKATGASTWAWASITLSDVSGISANALTMLTQTFAQMRTSLSLDQVNNTTDASKPVSTAQAAAIALKLDKLANNGGGKRHTVRRAPVDSLGNPNFIPTTSALLTSNTLQNVSASAPLVVTCAQGYDTTGALDAYGIATTNLAIPTLTGSVTNYLFATVSGGTLTLGVTTLAPIYQWGGVISVTSGQYTFDITQMKMFLGNGSVANPANVVFLGEIVANASQITSSICYAVNGISTVSPQLAITAATRLAYAHNIGIQDVNAFTWALNVTTEGGYTPGMIVHMFNVNNGTDLIALNATKEDRNTISIAIGTASCTVPIRTTGSRQVITAANWKIQMRAERPW